MHKYLPFLPIASHKLVSVSYCLLISQAKPFAEEACDTGYHLWKNGKLLEGRPGRVFRTVRSHLASFNMSPVCLEALCECLLSNDANWQCHASKSWVGGKVVLQNRTNWTGGYGAALSLSTLTEDA